MEAQTLNLYHGTSTLFLDSIIRYGLGGINPIADWDVLGFARALFPLVQARLASDEVWSGKAQTFGYMVEQKSSAMNFQHGQTYLSPSKQTAIRYAVNKRFGSEMLTYALDFLGELLRREVPGVRDDLFRRFPRIFELYDMSCAPVLVLAAGVEPGHLLSEHGGDASPNLKRVDEVQAGPNKSNNSLLGQTNFRLTHAVPRRQLTCWLISVARYDPFDPIYTLYRLDPATDESELNGSKR